MKSLVIAEKPSVARDLCRALGKFSKKNDYYENDDYIVTSAVGHIVELCMPEDYDKRNSFWRLGGLPIIPDSFKLKPIERSEDKFKQIKKLMSRKDVESVINACDAGREGELIFQYVYKLANCKKPVKRLWMLSMTPAGIRKAFQEMRDGETMKPLADAAQSRSEADWLIGINCTRGATKRLYGSRAGNVAGVGRVQTPTLAIVVERERAIRNFKPRDYWRVVANFKIDLGEYEGAYQKPNYRKGSDERDRPDRLWSEAEAKAVLEEVEAARQADVSEERKKTRQASPRLYDLTTLQREANNRLGYSARRVLQLAQALYEKHKLITYPRTDSRALPEDYPDTCRDTLKAIASARNETAREDALAACAAKVVNEEMIKPSNKRIFNNAQVSDHFAIIPTNERPKKLNDDEAKIYDMIARRFVAAFYPPAEFDVTTRYSKVGERAFKTEGKVLVFPGWLEVYGREAYSGGKDTLPALSEADGKPPKAAILGCESVKDATKPPARFSEATLLSAMEGAGKLVDDDELADAMKEKGLGTPATRAQIIERLLAEQYLERDNRQLVPTPKAENLLDFLATIDAEALTKPELTGEWEYKLRKVEEGKLSRETFMKEIVETTKSVVENIKSFDETEEPMAETDLVDPYSKEPLYESLRAYRSKDNDFAVYKTIGNRKITQEEVRELLEKKRIGPLDGFRSKRGKPFSAFLYLDDETKRVKFDFGNEKGGSDDDIDYSKLEPIAKCPRTGGDVYETPNAYIVRVNENGETKTALRVSRRILERDIPRDQFLKLLETGKTDLLEKFWSKRTKRPFDAYLVLKGEGKTGFEFPPRAAKKAAKKATKKTAK